jgi:hypothetical protein
MTGSASKRTFDPDAMANAMSKRSTIACLADDIACSDIYAGCGQVLTHLIDRASLCLENDVPDLLSEPTEVSDSNTERKQKSERLAFSFSLMRGESTSSSEGFSKNGGKNVRQISDE